MSTDMLEMILNKQPSRLTERVAKFIIYQVYYFFYKEINNVNLKLLKTKRS